MKTTYSPGKWLAICDVCGFRFYNDQLKKNWKNLMVCSHDFETRHPQDFIKGVVDNPSVPWVRPEVDDLFITLCTYQTSQAITGLGVAGCMRTGWVNPV